MLELKNWQQRRRIILMGLSAEWIQHMKKSGNVKTEQWKLSKNKKKGKK